MIKLPYIIIDDDPHSASKTEMLMRGFPLLEFVGSASDYNSALDLILEKSPALVFLEITPDNKDSYLSLQLINEVHRYLSVVPQFIATAVSTELAFEAIRYSLLDYLVKPLEIHDLRKTVAKFEKSFQSHSARVDKMIAEPMYTPTKNEDAPIILPIMNAVVDEPAITVAKERTELAGKPLTICVKSYGDYRFINADDICYVQADNNSTDIHLVNGEMITAFKTLKHFETVLPSPFVRIHNSYIVNIDYVSRIHTGNAVCYIKNTAIKLPFSKSYKENVDVILNSITTGNYLEI